MLDFLKGLGLDILDTITVLSHEFGTRRYVCGGGGNTSCKDAHTLWVKPSGTTLADLKPGDFIALDRHKLSELYTIEPPPDSAAREALVKEKMEKAVLPGISGRASVEAPLHNALEARFVVHTHPSLVNGMTCSKNGSVVCRQLFPDALWLDYIDPGYTLCMRVRREIQTYRQAYGREPALIFLKNHGLFAAADNAETIRSLYAQVMGRLEAEYAAAGISVDLQMGPMPSAGQTDRARQLISAAVQDESVHIAASGFFEPAAGPLTPDHIVYAKSYPFVGRPSAESIKAFQSRYGYTPQVMIFDEAVFGVSTSPKAARLALELAQDGGLVRQLAAAFGGVDYMTDTARQFIENWEVESYRKNQLTKQ
ncbi:MAG TPA: class II aldolase/adducin family protein [Anaerohalosphaeraceae bacterium]|nr:class II aldolase/adducin family protein [Anaerohalosphaeraceae bacterium]HPC63995.1 class II aldolase/adducin family protein [Anaerohalosphaeraceae bacterium]HRV20163.1 class II aldolase/adducin family protein [Anaerohalosphaeraceae bacterium]